MMKQTDFMHPFRSKRAPDGEATLALYRFVLTLPRARKAIILQTVEMFAVCTGFVMALWLAPAQPDLRTGAASCLAAMGLVALLTISLGLNHTRLIAYRGPEILQSALVAVAAGLVAAGVSSMIGPAVPAKFAILFALFYLITTVSARQILRELTVRLYENGQSRKRVMIYGAGQTGQQLVDALRTDDAVVPVCFVDDNPTLQGRNQRGLPVFASEQIPNLLSTRDIDLVVLAMPSVSRPVQSRIENSLRRMNCSVKTIPSFKDLLDGNTAQHTIRHVKMDRLMGRDLIEKDLPEVQSGYMGKRVLVTGAGGSIGSEICRQLMMFKPEALVMLDHSELALFEIERELAGLQSEAALVPILGSICESDLIRDVLQRYQIDTILHAAAYKHVPMVECNLIEGLRNNVLGTRTLAEAAIQAGVKQFTLISSDKAVRPTSAMGASKRLAELIIQDLATRSTDTQFGMVRFGNVLGSSGSVVPLFREQIAQGGPVTVTHPDVSRFFMTIPEAVRLVLLAGTFAKHGDVLVLKMGEPVLIRDIARQMIEGAGMSVRDAANPGGDIEITFTGLRPGEKIQEELLLCSDMVTTPHPKIMRAKEQALSELQMASILRDLRGVVRSRDTNAAHALLDRWVEGRALIGPQKVVPAE